ncbi:peptide ABC superfamily ATP binding cassette transporter permease/transmembrane protein [Enterococcus sp. C1]|uniref:ABC transporter permease n=1 Tax=unclassified Enterococcus TaxID=2608891 RepID=UPI000271F081|nr:FtsX-like permease family protein [Enterococcus sp. C1]EJF50154.1 peptide ABC superfamily ATP binding cassette transporter permease/transmembrane protein [Enterococcus sp. C1]VTT36061.1 peptide ABC transporter permease/transmembrane protein [Enterococcus casseliflavus]
MLWKLSLTGIKGRLKDYIVLFSGLVMASAIFYMFESMASNEAFLKSNSIISMVVFIFRFGSVLLGIITFAYILYANSFLMAMRQKDYAMFMMLGAKGRKIAQMIFIETFLVGIAATAVGSLLGIGLASGVNTLLVNQLNLQISHYAAFNLQALVVTLAFFSILFLIAAIFNARAIAKKSILALLRETSTPAQVKQRPFMLFLQTVLGICSLAVGYYMMSDLMKFQLMGIGVALVTIILGTYLVFRSVIITILSLLKRTDAIALKRLNNFTLSQLSFRIRDYTQMLSMVAMLFALALGALTVGLGFKNEIPIMAKSVAPYDLYLNNAQNASDEKVAALKPTLDVTYSLKETDDTLYYNKDQFNKNNLLSTSTNQLSIDVTYSKLSGDQLAKDITAQDQLRSYLLPEQRGKEIQVVDQTAFDTINAPESSLRMVQVKDFQASYDALHELAQTNQETNTTETADTNFSQRVFVYDTYNGLFSGFEFMGFFLGIAFLTMLASCLMFKILSGANSDIQRYTMLKKIGTRTSLLKGSIRKEIGVLFLVPGILGMIHVLFGLQMFTTLMIDPYHDLWLPFGIFIALYAIYYVVTIWLYTNIVLRPNKK